MNHIGTQKIETDRLILRRFEKSDSMPMYKNWASDPEVVKYMTWSVHPNADVTAMIVDDWVKSYENKDSYNWIITLKESKEPVGSISVVGIDEAVCSAEIGYTIARDFWRRGIATEALKAVIAYLFEKGEFLRIAATHDKNNPNSGAVMKKAGMSYEGTLRKSRVNNQGIVDTCCYSILKSEYKPK